jgi:hypothetical protein
MPTKIIAALAALVAFGATTISPAVAAGHGGGGGFHGGGGFGGGFHGGGFHSGGGFGHMGVAHAGGGYRVDGGHFYGRRFYGGGGFGIYPGYPYATVCSPYYWTYLPCY